MSEPSSTAGPAPSAGGSGESGASPSQETAQDRIDLEALAGKVLRLLKDEARLERERLGRRPPG